MAQFLPSWYKLYADGRGTNIIAFTNLSWCSNLVEGTLRSIAVQKWSEQGICHGVGFFKLADECVTDLRALETLFDAGTSCKNCDKKITTTVPVSKCLIIVSLKNL